ncbi:ClpP/crotonase-like domain-containing protein [Ephemerocybe angulata]|uniref:ClpP/crotonase-like domain-containing protein n=1 Tax=Ephemerocybe angulata TaxID=980116 RepID=A0A8H6LXK6_9AGAR|nr:ClpP/crotonase-like domain-containing protein [Tulosesus angulatus]
MPSDADNEGKGRKGTDVVPVDDGKSWEGPLSQLRAQQALVRSPNLEDPGYARQKANKKLWVRERVALLLDKEIFNEVGSITGQPIYDKATGKLVSFVPANMVTGWGKLDGRKVFITADDFSVRGGHADGGIMNKPIYGEGLARRARVPLIRLLDGSSGGGSVATYLSMGATYIPGMNILSNSLDALSVIPVVSALLGPVVGLAAAKAAISPEYYEIGTSGRSAGQRLSGRPGVRLSTIVRASGFVRLALNPHPRLQNPVLLPLLILFR